MNNTGPEITILAIWLCIVWFVYCLWYAINENAKINNNFQLNCIKSWWVMTLVPGRYSEFYCNINK